MKISFLRSIGTAGAGLLIALSLAACQRQEAARTAAEPPPADETMTTQEEPSGQEQMPPATMGTPATTTPGQAAGQSYSATGTVTTVDPNAGSVTIQHEGVAGANLAAGTNQFQVENQEALRQLSSGQKVEFTFTMPSTGADEPVVTQIAPAAGQATQSTEQSQQPAQ